VTNMEGILNIGIPNPVIRCPFLEIQHTDSEVYILGRAVKRDRTAFAALYDLYLDRVYRYVCYWLPNRADAEDITQEVFVKAWHSIDKYKVTGAPFVSWLITIARNLVNSHHRASKRLVPLPETDSVISNNPGPQAEAEMNFTRNYVRDAISKLKGEKQKVIQMRFINEMGYEEVAQALNKTEGAIRVLQYRALKDLRGILEKDKR